MFEKKKAPKKMEAKLEEGIEPELAVAEFAQLPDPKAKAEEPKEEAPPREPYGYRVKGLGPSKGVFSWYGSVTKLTLGDFLDVKGYGKIGIQRIIDAGIELEPVCD